MAYQIELEYGDCCCCLGKGNYRSLTKTYYWNERPEIYEHLFKDTFDIVLNYPEQTKLICDTCIVELRQARHFRSKVESTQQKLSDPVNWQPEFDNDWEEPLELFDIEEGKCESDKLYDHNKKSDNILEVLTQQTDTPVVDMQTADYEEIQDMKEENSDEVTFDTEIGSCNEEMEETNNDLEENSENELFSLSLSTIGDSDLKAIFPKIGPRVLFKRNLQNYRKTMHLDPDNTDVTEDDYICNGCWDLATSVIHRRIQEAQVTPGSSQPVSGPSQPIAGPSQPQHIYRKVCVTCGCSILRRRSQLVIRQNPTEQIALITTIIANAIRPREVLYKDLDADHVSILNKYTFDTSTTVPIITAPSERPITICDLNDLLKCSLEGKGLLNWNKNIPLDNSARQRLVRIIGTSILCDNPDQVVRTTDLTRLTREIVRVFPKEKPFVYFHSKMVNSSRGVITRRLAGKLPDQIHNLKRKYRLSGVLEKRRRNRRSSLGAQSPMRSLRLPEGSVCTEKDASETIQWLRNFDTPWSLVVQNWVATTRERLNLSKELHVCEYFKEYPALRSPNGYVLLEKDFEELYAGSYTNICDTFPPLRDKIFQLAEKRKRSNKDTFLEELVGMQNSSEEMINIACMLLVPSLITVASIQLKNCSRKIWRPTKSEIREGFITHVKKYADISSVVNCRRDKLKQFNLKLEPFIIIVGPSLTDIKTYLVVIDEVWYSVSNILAAVTTCFKLTWVVNAKYPIECHGTWMFIQCAFFKFRTVFDIESTCAHTLLGDLGIDIE